MSANGQLEYIRRQLEQNHGFIFKENWDFTLKPKTNYDDPVYKSIIDELHAFNENVHSLKMNIEKYGHVLMTQILLPLKYLQHTTIYSSSLLHMAVTFYFLFEGGCGKYSFNLIYQVIQIILFWGLYNLQFGECFIEHIPVP